MTEPVKLSLEDYAALWPHATLFDLHVDLPVFHAWRVFSTIDGDRAVRNDRTHCGRESSTAAEYRSTSMPIRHACRFARPCRRCFTEDQP